MNVTEHLLTCLAEECVEVAQRATKALRFGLSEIQPGQNLDNAERIVVEVKDLIAILKLLEERGEIPSYEPSSTEINAKIDKVGRFMIYAETQGALQC